MIRKLAYILITLGIILVVASQMHSDPDIINWESYSEALKFAKKDNKLIFVYFYSDNCPYCKSMSSKVFSDERIAGILNEKFTPVKVNVRVDSDLVKKFVSSFKEKNMDFVTPSYIIIDSNERIIDMKEGYLEKSEFEKFIMNVNK